MELSELQKQIVTAPAEKMVVISRAATGKTRCLTERVRHLLREGVTPSSICCITFTNLAANEMQVRLAEDYKDGMFIGTIHALAARFLLMGGYGAQVGKAIDEEKFDRFFEVIKVHPECVQHFDYVLVDEAQDLSYDEYSFIFKMIQPNNFFVVGDPFQCIYETMNGASPYYMNRLAAEPDVVTYDLNENYRNKANILQYAQKALRPIGLRDNSIPMTVGGTIYEGKYDLDKLCEWIDSSDNYRDWAILCYTNAEVEYIMKQLKSEFIPTINFNQRKKTKKEIDDLMNQDKVKVLTVWGAKGLGFPYVVVYGKNWVALKNNDETAYREGARLNYVAYTRAMDSLMVLAPVSKKRKVKI